MKKILQSLALGALLATSALAGAAHADGEKFVWISHGPDSDSWFNVIKNAIKVTNEQMGVETEYRNPPSGDLADMARLVQQSSAAGVDGIIVTIADFNVLEGPIKDAVAKGIPVVTVNSGTVEESQKLGALLHVGQPEYEAGLGAGKRAKEAGIKSFLCVNHYITNPASVERCRGFAEGIGVELGNQMVDSGIDPSEVQNKVKAYLTANPDTGAILTLGPNSAEPSIRAVKEMGLDGDIYFGTFDLSAEISAAIKDGTINFAIDQQPFLQGSIPIQVLTNYVRYGVTPSNSIFTGPGFVTKDNIALVESLAGQYR
ncbi:sugar ABC transporter substrate-binding protein [Shinella sumterensis]|uniref:sugar ABC transporter substrate-binding protein n=1 Tax=Shinella sumterensis TaxID=1967501 RepID=UPI00106EC68A|nr:sugar ABC transporter substrate-binding protein [Shinella sumterensis]MCD1266989.1 substrate-binding domain-containing protein [Shinella sumterensis]TFE95136.1 sugar ABC transporter substrate-binding protein [Shinella sumterensis]